ncbi:MAG: hypothetical protein H6937_07935 [Burkholderiales bacterium]|nr:hypothetical protein [Burkholderiales bacterium]MDR4517000.1 hypothetical protein [Nitrosomonas sp.]
MSMRKWTDEELVSTRDKLEEWRSKYQKAGNKMWHLTAFLGAFAVSTGIAFIFLDGVDVLNVLLIVMGSLTCLAWYKSEKRRKDNLTFLAEIDKEMKQRAKKTTKSKAKQDKGEKVKKESDTDQSGTADEQKPNADKIDTDNGTDKESKQ